MRRPSVSVSLPEGRRLDIGLQTARCSLRRVRDSASFGNTTIEFMASLHESTDFSKRSALPRGWENDVFRHCTFSNLDIEGSAFEGVLVGCRIKDSCWYWGLFNITKFVEVEFRNCVFRGSGFAGCLFVRCRFENCRFTKDNLEANCRFTECSWFECEQTGCEGLPRQFASEIKRREE